MELNPGNYPGVENTTKVSFKIEVVVQDLMKQDLKFLVPLVSVQKIIKIVEAYLTKDICSEDELMKTIVFWSLMFVAIGAADFIGFTAYAFLFGKAGEELTMRLRYQSFKKYLQLEMGYFDDAFNSTGTLTARLASDASKVQVIDRPCFVLINKLLIITH